MAKVLCRQLTRKALCKNTDRTELIWRVYGASGVVEVGVCVKREGVGVGGEYATKNVSSLSGLGWRQCRRWKSTKFDGFAVSGQLLHKHQSKHNLIKTFKPKT